MPISREQLPQAFLESATSIFGAELEQFLKSLEDKTPVSIRVNPNKNYTPNTEWKPVKWADQAYYLPERPAFFADPDFHTGAYYVQEASSMVIDLILRQLPLPEKTVALDLCAAPGGKSTLMSSFLGEKGLLVSNELVWKRNLILQENLERWGCGNTLITHNKSEDFTRLLRFFDLALIDAPCSGEGMFRKDPRVVEEWSPQNVAICAERQDNILQNIAPTIREGGYIIYSTCTYNRDENEKQVAQLLDTGEWQCVPISGLTDLGINLHQEEDVLNYRFFPHKTQGEGFSVSVLQKKGDGAHKMPKKIRWRQFKELKEASDYLKDYLNLKDNQTVIQRENDLYLIDDNYWDSIMTCDSYLRVIRPGLHLGELNRQQFIPSHSLALANDVELNIPDLPVDHDNALRILKKDASGLNQDYVKVGWISLSYHGNRIALAKALPNRLNIHLPKTFRIRKDIEDFLLDD